MLNKRTFLKTTAALAAVVSARRAFAYSAKGSTLQTGQFLAVGDYLVAGNRQFFVVMQDDGNLAVYRGSGPGERKDFVWGSVQAGRYAAKPGSYFAVMQDDGNLAMYQGSGPADRRDFVWGSVQDGGYAPRRDSYFAVMQDDGNFVVYRGAISSGQRGFVWGSVQSLEKR
jgi:hypothetical protein